MPLTYWLTGSDYLTHCPYHIYSLYQAFFLSSNDVICSAGFFDTLNSFQHNACFAAQHGCAVQVVFCNQTKYQKNEFLSTDLQSQIQFTNKYLNSLG